MTKLEQTLITQIKSKLAGLDKQAADKLAALQPELKKLTAAYALLGSTAKTALAELFPELAALIETVEAQLQ